MVLSYIYSADGGLYLLVLDGKAFEEVARIMVPSVFNASFHS